MAKFLIDECLSPELAAMARKEGHVESAHVNHRKMTSWPDPELMHKIIADDWTFVTSNANDFRPKPGSGSKKPLYVDIELHAGLVCLNLPPKNDDKAVQLAYFQKALDDIGCPGDLVNMILEVDPDPETPGRIMLRKYEFPKSDS